jgi:hypothetical protein
MWVFNTSSETWKMVFSDHDVNGIQSFSPPLTVGPAFWYNPFKPDLLYILTGLNTFINAGTDPNMW